MNNNKYLSLIVFQRKLKLLFNIKNNFNKEINDLYNIIYGLMNRIHENYNNVEVIGLPCNQFLFQEPFSESKIKNFCSLNYDITFLMTQKIKVKGKNQHNIYKWLTNKYLNNSFNSTVKWNFQKYLVSKTGELIDCFYSKTSPLSEKITNHLV